jgi:hypothetical protein
MEYERLATKTADLDLHTKTLAYIRWLPCVHENGGPVGAYHTFALRWPRAIHRDLIEKTAVAPGMTNDATWGGPLSPIEPCSNGGGTRSC